MSEEQKGNPELKDQASKGGRARANVLSAEERKEIARKAVMARWAKLGKLKVSEPNLSEPLMVQEIEGPKNPRMPHALFPGKLNVGVEVDCYVLNDLRRVISQRGMVKILSGGRESGGLQRYLNNLHSSFNTFSADQPIRFRIPA